MAFGSTRLGDGSRSEREQRRGSKWEGFLVFLLLLQLVNLWTGNSILPSATLFLYSHNSPRQRRLDTTIIYTYHGNKKTNNTTTTAARSNKLEVKAIHTTNIHLLENKQQNPQLTIIHRNAKKEVNNASKTITATITQNKEAITSNVQNMEQKDDESPQRFPHTNNRFGNDYRWLRNRTILHQELRHHAIVVPYRNRSTHLQEFVPYMNSYLYHYYHGANTNTTFSLWIMEQDNSALFNRGWLANVGLHQILAKQPHTTCVIFHDVDLLPMNSSHAQQVPYDDCGTPLQLASEVKHFDWDVPYDEYCGGIVSLSLKDWQQINGMSNDYEGWGGEDDDLYYRLRIHNLTIPNPVHPAWVPTPRRPPKGQGLFCSISEWEEDHPRLERHIANERMACQKKLLLAQMQNKSAHWQEDGLSSVFYTITNVTTHQLNYGFDVMHHIKVVPPTAKNAYHKGFHEAIPGHCKPNRTRRA